MAYFNEGCNRRGQLVAHNLRTGFSDFFSASLSSKGTPKKTVNYSYSTWPLNEHTWSETQTIYRTSREGSAEDKQDTS